MEGEPHDWSPAQKLRLIVVGVVGGILVLALLFFGYQRYQASKPKEGVERIEELGSGFRRVTIAKFNKTELVRYPYFYYKGRLLSQIEPKAPPSISPSGNFAAYTDPRSGKLMLFRRTDERTTPLTTSFIGIPGQFVWHEDEGNVEVALSGVSAVFPLQ